MSHGNIWKKKFILIKKYVRNLSKTSAVRWDSFFISSQIITELALFEYAIIAGQLKNK